MLSFLRADSDSCWNSIEKKYFHFNIYQKLILQIALNLNVSRKLVCVFVYRCKICDELIKF